MIIYTILFSGLFITAILDIISVFNQKQKYIIFWAWVIIFILLKGLRWDTGSDWAQYYACFENANWTNIFSYHRYGTGTTLMEPGYVFINALINTFLNHYTFFLLITNAFILTIFAKTIYKYIPKYQLATLALAIVSLELFPVRQTITFAILCYSLKYILEKKLLKYIVCTIICFTFHRSSLIYLSFYFILNTKYNFYRNILIYTLLIISAKFLYDIFDYVGNIDIIRIATGGIMDTYNATTPEMMLMDAMSDKKPNALVYISSLTQLSLYSYCFYKTKDEKLRKVFNLFLNMYFTLLCLNAIGLVPGFGSIYRLSNSLAICYPMCIGLSFNYIKQQKIFPPLLFSIGLFIITFYIKLNTQAFTRPGTEGYYITVPYKSFLQENEILRSGKW